MHMRKLSIFTKNRRPARRTSCFPEQHPEVLLNVIAGQIIQLCVFLVETDFHLGGSHGGEPADGFMAHGASLINLKKRVGNTGISIDVDSESIKFLSSQQIFFHNHMVHQLRLIKLQEITIAFPADFCRNGIGKSSSDFLPESEQLTAVFFRQQAQVLPRRIRMSLP